MAKSVYSIVLSDAVVELVDALAARQGVSRSAAINSILAAHLSMTTPEQQMRGILAQALRLLEDGALAISPTLDGGFLAMHAPVRFKYHPTVRCTVSLTPSPFGAQVELRAAARTQSAHLTKALDEFFGMFTQAAGFDSGTSRVDQGRLISQFILPLQDEQEAAQTLADLLDVMQRAMRGFFLEYPDSFGCARAVREAFGRSGYQNRTETP